MQSRPVIQGRQTEQTDIPLNVGSMFLSAVFCSIVTADIIPTKQFFTTDYCEFITINLKLPIFGCCPPHLSQGASCVMLNIDWVDTGWTLSTQSMLDTLVWLSVPKRNFKSVLLIFNFHLKFTFAPTPVYLSENIIVILIKWKVNVTSLFFRQVCFMNGIL